jgi:hypothetical protein
MRLINWSINHVLTTSLRPSYVDLTTSRRLTTSQRLSNVSLNHDLTTSLILSYVPMTVQHHKDSQHHENSAMSLPMSKCCCNTPYPPIPFVSYIVKSLIFQGECHMSFLQMIIKEELLVGFSWIALVPEEVDSLPFFQILCGAKLHPACIS